MESWLLENPEPTIRLNMSLGYVCTKLFTAVFYYYSYYILYYESAPVCKAFTELNVLVVIIALRVLGCIAFIVECPGRFF